jgi:hypothetical protein
MEPSKFLVQMDSTAQYPVPRNSSSSDKFSANNKSPITSLQDPMLYLDRVVSKSKLEASAFECSRAHATFRGGAEVFPVPELGEWVQPGWWGTGGSEPGSLDGRRGAGGGAHFLSISIFRRRPLDLYCTHTAVNPPINEVPLRMLC